MSVIGHLSERSGEAPAVPVGVASYGAEKWCILRTAGQKTIALAVSLSGAGFEVWVPVRTVKRPAPGQRRRLHMGQRRRMMAVAVPILAGFVFARADRLDDLLRLVDLPTGTNHPPFSVFQFGGRVPLVGDASVAGLREEEALAQAERHAEIEAEARDAARRERAERLRTESARRKALRSERKVFANGDQVIVDDMPAMSGVVGTVVTSNGTSAIIDFGGSLKMKVEAWQVLPAVVRSGHPLREIAA